MSKIYVTEYSGLAGSSQGGTDVPIFAVPALAEYSVIVSAASSGAAAPFNPATKFIEVSTDTTCSIVIGLFPGVIGTGVAGVGNCRLQSNDRIVRRVPQTQPQQMTGNPYLATPSYYAIFTTANV
jgi:hypothetical protein